MVSNEILLFSVVFKFVAMVIGVLGNTTVIIYTTFWTKEKTTTSCLVRNLAVADLFVCLTFYPIWIVEFIQTILDIDSDQDLFCKLSRSTMFAFLFASVNSLLAITVDRYFYIVKPLRYPLIVTHRRVFVAISAIWLTACFIFSINYSLITNFNIKHLCHLPYGIYYSMDSITGYIPITLILILNVHLFLVAYKQRKRILTCSGWYETEKLTTNRMNLVPRFLVGLKAAKTFSIIAAVLVLCILIPLVLSKTICRLCSKSCSRDYHAVFHYEFYGINSIANAFIYGMRHVKYRKAFKNIFLKIIGRFKVKI